ncbi:N6-L-threonylcarbamoyladenine synthase [Dyadobacter jejuensis]|uniref:tRNA N6-adenosine threonylcarbamoyltransferase n=1 Tax=Dyadobacter jejuensis TaxID=1082580 RepID=A0A316ASD3_9BACT|nr:tRNA (adenosine(37)-N6)-threonylcarbamoyltransferase complex transferase subunit TsaD [Dyadobacter jejuensis]PWJ60522.1 N6-L-threonylcarbamoyladenine synthase [Dyadobacter jejuensis]
MNILAIESSCDETSAAVIVNGQIASNVIATQLIHAQYGGVVPELASRAHQQHILPVVTKALSDAKVAKIDLDAVAFTKGPGLLGALLVGTSFAKAMALGLGIPLIEVNHMQAHVLAHFITAPQPSFPFLCLTVSGGHTQIVRVNSPLAMEVIGQTKDDAVGEAFDKTAKLLGLPYPGGPLIDRYAKEGNPLAYPFPLTEMPGLDYSFSGIKTSILYFLQKQVQQEPEFIPKNLADICASVQHTLIEILMNKLKRASRETGIKEIAIAGGVSANSGLRKALVELAHKHQWKTYIPDFEYCTDNAAMIAMAAHYKFLAGDFADQSASPMPRMHL